MAIEARVEIKVPLAYEGYQSVEGLRERDHSCEVVGLECSDGGECVVEVCEEDVELLVLLVATGWVLVWRFECVGCQDDRG